MLTGMEFWKDFPITNNNDSNTLPLLPITSPETWLRLMNHSTAKLGLSYFPPNLLAVPHNFSSFDTIPTNSLVITLPDPDSSRLENNPQQLDQLIYGLICTLAGIWVAAWAAWTWYHNGTLLIPRVSPPGSKDVNNDVELGAHTAVVDFVSPETFHAGFLKYYYDVSGDEHQLADNIFSHSADSHNKREKPVTGEDVEELTKLVQKMYEIDVELFGLQDARYITEDKKDKLRRKREAMLVEAARVVESWADRRWLHINKWEEGEYDTVLEILDVLREYVEAERQKRVYVY
ncbi:uncharacterized protein PODANS_6_8210 [Podospora anserina S mat+]|uniref:Podospora anserina S mat+ genomic DNA chromosome 6, supercontig 4 n=1 Tax=Podospora anserina (strain S / ATCC MYA-4624 / DSM 980 / FGSC 10383) TaxID=515849 RepID=B2AMW7_PODAN|nr:uncharacterized protein PODANS_6_8210 [Podospora anserina S mat+]CAP65308.1 unnamed protein product [Podospora anserina S mat+]CDP31305.1 Putative protein of unknown function [Podospora anserina S mat+]